MEYRIRTFFVCHRKIIRALRMFTKGIKQMENHEMLPAREGKQYCGLWISGGRVATVFT